MRLVDLLGSIAAIITIMTFVIGHEGRLVAPETPAVVIADDVGKTQFRDEVNEDVREFGTRTGQNLKVLAHGIKNILKKAAEGLLFLIKVAIVFLSPLVFSRLAYRIYLNYLLKGGNLFQTKIDYSYLAFACSSILVYLPFFVFTLAIIFPDFIVSVWFWDAVRHLAEME